MSGCPTNDGSNMYGDKCLVRCKRGYKAIGGSLERKCNYKGQWTGDELICQGKKCTFKEVDQLIRFCFSQLFNIKKHFFLYVFLIALRVYLQQVFAFVVV